MPCAKAPYGSLDGLQRPHFISASFTLRHKGLRTVACLWQVVSGLLGPVRWAESAFDCGRPNPASPLLCHVKSAHQRLRWIFEV